MRVLSADVTEQHHERGQNAGGGCEADQRLEEQRHGATPNEQASNKDSTQLVLRPSLMLVLCQRCVSG